MKEPSPLVPQGSFEAQARSKSRVKLAFYTIVAIHILAIGGFLIIGCKRDEKDATANAMPTNDIASTPPIGSDPGIITPAVTNTNPTAGIATGIPPVTPNTGIVAAPIVPTPLVPSNPPPVITDAGVGAATEHVIAKGDSFSTLATKYGVSVKAIQAANPGKDSTKLKIGDKIRIPAKTATAPPASSTGGAPASDAGVYTVRSGDTLSKIASAHRTTIKELQKLNNLNTTQIKVGQKLKVPPTASPAAAASGGTVVPTGTTPPPAQ